MPTDASIAMSVQDNLSAAITSMKTSVTNFRTDITSLQGELDRLNSTRVQMRMDLSGAKREAQQAQRAMEALGDSASEAERKAAEADWRKAEENLENIRQQYDLVGRQVRQTTRDMENATSAISRAENRASSAVSGGGTTGLLAALGKAGILNMAGDTTSQLANALVGSAFGGQAGALFSGALSGAVSGAALGSIIPGVGTVAGAAIGGGIGLLSGATQNFQERDEAFKSYVQEATQGQLESMSEGITSGSAIAAQRELDAIAFNRLLGEGVGDQYLTDLRTLASSTPMEYADLTSMSRALATGFGADPERMLELMTAIGDAGSAVGVSSSDMTEMARALSRMESSGKASLEFLNIFQDRGVDVIGMLGDALGKTQGEIYDMISKGEISGQGAVDIIQKGLDRYAGSMDQMALTFSGLESTLSDARAEMDNAYGEGYNEIRKKGLQDENDYLSGESGALIQEANRAMGAWQAELENSKEQYIRDAMDAVLNSEEYKAAMESGTDEGYAEAGRMLMEAKVRGMNEYNASEGAQLMLEYEKTMAETIRNDAATNDAYWDAGYEKGQAYLKGLAAGRLATPEVEVSGGIEGISDEKAEEIYRKTGGLVDVRRDTSPNGKAFGLSNVPRDGLYYLHQDERVQTAQEARSEKTRTPIKVTITGNTFGAGVTAEEMAQRLADAIERKLAAGVLS